MAAVGFFPQRLLVSARRATLFEAAATLGHPAAAAPWWMSSARKRPSVPTGIAARDRRICRLFADLAEFGSGMSAKPVATRPPCEQVAFAGACMLSSAAP